MSSETKAPQPPAEAQPERYACNGPEGTFWTDDAALANKLIGAAFDRDEWTVTDTQNPTGAAPPPSAPVGVDAIRIADDLETWVNDPFVTLTPMRKMDVEDFVRRIRALAQKPAAACHCYTTDPTNCIGTDDLAGLDCPCKCHAQQPAAVAPVGVEGLVGNWQARAEMERAESKNKEWAEWMRENHAGAASAFATCASQLEQALAQQPAADAGQWVRCTPELLSSGVSCAKTPRRPGDGHSHDHFIAHTPQQPADADEVEDVATGVRKVALAMKKRSLDGATRSALLYSDDLRVYANCLLSLVAQQGGDTDE